MSKMSGEGEVDEVSELVASLSGASLGENGLQSALDNSLDSSLAGVGRRAFEDEDTDDDGGDDDDEEDVDVDMDMDEDDEEERDEDDEWDNDDDLGYVAVVISEDEFYEMEEVRPSTPACWIAWQVCFPATPLVV